MLNHMMNHMLYKLTCKGVNQKSCMFLDKISTLFLVCNCLGIVWKLFFVIRSSNLSVCLCIKSYCSIGLKEDGTTTTVSSL